MVIPVIGSTPIGFLHLEHAPALHKLVVNRVGRHPSPIDDAHREHELIAFPDEAHIGSQAPILGTGLFAICRQLIGSFVIALSGREDALELEIRLPVFDNEHRVI